jgi:hypothetical protein
MSHLDEGRLLELRDETRDGDIDAWHHLDACSHCREALEDVRSRATAIGSALGSLDGPLDLEAARSAVRDRVAGHSAAVAGATSIVAAPSRSGLRGLSRAAGILLVAAGGVAAAVPGSPLRQWVSTILGPEDASETPMAQPAEAVAPERSAAEAAGIRVEAVTGPLRITLRGFTPGVDLRVRWVPGSEAAVFAPLGTRFTRGQGRVEADLSVGEVRVELPTGSSAVTLEVDGVVYLTRGEAGLEILGPVASRAADEVVFRSDRP